MKEEKRAQQQRFARWCDKNPDSVFALEAALVRARGTKEGNRPDFTAVFERWSSYVEADPSMVSRRGSAVVDAEELAIETTWQSYDFFVQKYPTKAFRDEIVKKLKKRKISNKQIQELVKNGTLDGSYAFEYQDIVERKKSSQRTEEHVAVEQTSGVASSSMPVTFGASQAAIEDK